MNDLQGVIPRVPNARGDRGVRRARPPRRGGRGRGRGRGIPPNGQPDQADQTPAMDEAPISDVAVKKQKLYAAGRKFLENVVKQNPRVLVLSLQDQSFKKLLESSSFKDDILIMIVHALSAASTCDSCPENLMALLNNVLSSDLLMLHVPKFLTLAPHMPDKRPLLPTVLQHLAVLFNRLLEGFPCKAADQLGIALVTIKDILDRGTKMGIDIKPDLVALFEDMDQRRRSTLETFDSKTREKKVQEESSMAQAPPDDFRVMAITPTAMDIHEILEPFLRPNIISGAFTSVEHYLDVHFRLMREDFVAPLRDGVVNYLSLVSRGIQHRVNSKEIKVYHDVHLTIPECCTYEGVCQRLTFNVDMLKKVRWEATKRLLHGSLVCLSANNFREFFSAVIVKRDPKDLKEGQISVRFIADVQKAWAINPNAVFTMIESPAYFEAYSPILRGLQTMNGTTMPFQQYIISGSTNVAVPRYLLDTTEFYVSPLLDAEIRVKRAPKCTVLAPHTWPTAEDMGLDPAQYAALKAALTREVAIIQGPPGTGKTFLGLKIMEMLLRNSDVWSPEPNPILVICFTNHALDQFLEGMLKFAPDSIVRVGGRSKCEVLAPYNLNHLRRVMSDGHRIPHYVFYNRKRLYYDMKQIEEDIAKLTSLIKSSESRIIHENLLAHYMREEHFRQLEHGHFGSKEKTKAAITEWLGLVAGEQQAGPIYGQFPGLLPVPGQAHQNHEEEESDEDDVLAEEEIGRRIVDDYQDDNDLDNVRWLRYLAEVERQNEQYLVPLATSDQEWKAQGGKKGMEKRIRVEMRKVDKMTDEEEAQVRHIMALAVPDRWRLYRHWVAKIREERQGKVRSLLEEYENKFAQLKEVLRELDVVILQNAKVVGMTTTGAAKQRDVLQQIAPKIVMVEEAAEVLESHVVGALTQHCEHLILIGDQQQLRPNPTVFKLAKDYKLDVSLFERFVKNGLPYERLELQHRMRPSIAALLVPHIYKDLRNHSSVEEYEVVRGVDSNLFFINHDSLETTVVDSSSRANEFEADFVVAFCKYLLLQGYDPSRITILATYLGQLFLIKRKVKNTIVRDVHCTVVDNFQGEENDIIILSLVRSNAEGNVGFLKVDNRVCVALSRARIGLFCVGNFEFLMENAQIWKSIMDYVKAEKMIGDKLVLRCQNHPKVMSLVGCAKDFDKVPEGGCQLPCEYRLSCGHQCPKVCHVYDMEHVKTKCLKPCAKVLCDLGHQCPRKCSDECGICLVVVPKEFYCGHVNSLPCHKDPATAMCRQPCQKKLSCGHDCKLQCYDICSTASCIVQVSKKSLCGHKVKIPCGKRKNHQVRLAACHDPCKELLPCEHPCPGSCSKCYQGRMHCKCVRRCGRTLICGHACNVPCSRACPPCQKPCENRCIHSRCPNVCGVPCKPCMEKCGWQCEHHECSKKCSELCDRPPCNEPCTMILRCGHPCIGLCGEPCPEQCRVCHSSEVSEIFFGSEDEEDARFILLEDCNHIIEVGGMDQWMEQSTEAKEAQQVDMKCCPKCKTIIRRNLRYGNMVKKQLNDVIEIKKKLFGDTVLLKRNIKSLHAEVEILQKKSYCAKNSYELQNKINNKLSSAEYTAMQSLSNLLEKMQQMREKLDYNDVNYNPISRAWREQLHRLGPVRERSEVRITEQFATKVENVGIMLQMEDRMAELESWHLKLDKQSTEKELTDCNRAVSRLGFFINILMSIQNLHLHISPECRHILNRIKNNCLGLHPYTEDVENEVHRDLEEFKKRHTGLAVSEEEKIQIVRAIGLREGHWFKCPNGHFYAIGECGGGNQISRCIECNAAIGGENHSLTTGNAFAPEMDGASAPQWPTMLRG